MLLFLLCRTRINLAELASDFARCAGFVETAFACGEFAVSWALNELTQTQPA